MSKSYKELRDWYAGLAMQAIIQAFDGDRQSEAVAEDAFEMSEAMMDQREKVMENE